MAEMAKIIEDFPKRGRIITSGKRSNQCFTAVEICGKAERRCNPKGHKDRAAVVNK